MIKKSAYLQQLKSVDLPLIDIFATQLIRFKRAQD